MRITNEHVQALQRRLFSFFGYAHLSAYLYNRELLDIHELTEEDYVLLIEERYLGWWPDNLPHSAYVIGINATDKQIRAIQNMSYTLRNLWTVYCFLDSSDISVESLRHLTKKQASDLIEFMSFNLQPKIIQNSVSRYVVRAEIRDRLMPHME